MQQLQLQLQDLPKWLQDPLDSQVLSPEEALGLWDAYLQTPGEGFAMLPESLWPAAQRLFLWEAEPPEGLPLQ